jgi:hypothetical protein
MGWATYAIEALRRGEMVTITPRGSSMQGRVEDGQAVVVRPCDPSSLAVGDVVLCKVRGKQYLHLIKAIDDGRFLIGNNRGHTNGWIGSNGIYGRADV